MASGHRNTYASYLSVRPCAAAHGHWLLVAAGNSRRFEQPAALAVLQRWTGARGSRGLASADGRRRVRVRFGSDGYFTGTYGPVRAAADPDAVDPEGSAALAATLDGRFVRLWFVPAAPDVAAARAAKRVAAARLIARRAKAAAASPYTELGRRVIMRRGGFDPCTM